MAKDNFSKQSAIYARFRPNYPEALYQLILNKVNNRDLAWDCATGNGQAAIYLAGHFKHVYATDLSESQISNAKPANNITYFVNTVENTAFDENTFDLVTVAQALHWFDFDKYFKEVIKVAKPGAVFAAWGYGLFRSDKTIDKAVDHFYNDVVGDFWDPERDYIDKMYSNIDFPFPLIECPTLETKLHWSIDHLQGYLNSWSSVQNFITENEHNPVDQLIDQLKPYWGKGLRVIKHPLFLKMGIME